MKRAQVEKGNGIGIDIIAIVRFRGLKKTDYRHWSGVFTQSEWTYAFSDSRPSQHLAGIFAVKEAAIKAFGRMGAGRFLDFEVRHAPSGKPALNRRRALVSISHEQRYAIAIVLALE